LREERRMSKLKDFAKRLETVEKEVKELTCLHTETMFTCYGAASGEECTICGKWLRTFNNYEEFQQARITKAQKVVNKFMEELERHREEAEKIRSKKNDVQRES
jgi:uncharacterized protein (UPF0335 family)